MAQDQSVPCIWLLSDRRNDAVLEDAILRLPPRSGFVFRHYHLDAELRANRFAHILPLLRRGGHWAIISGDAATAQAWGADGIYGQQAGLPPAPLRWIATAHNAAELDDANTAGATAVMLSPVFPTRSHPGGATLGMAPFRALAARSAIPVIALGGMTAARARELDWPRWAAIDGLTQRGDPSLCP
ncbi:thiamine phosphate synthase [Erythrobacter sp. R86502]|uniref:thiamine phosphate synthase n=1 Tax=Erythrobacter sp. R86502 TaxID=3093846 RepID=UPI0036D23C0B